MVDNDKGQGVVLYKFDQFCITFNSYYFRKSDKGVYRKGNFKLVYRFTRLFFNENNGPGNGTDIPWEGICGNMLEEDVDITVQKLMQVD